MSRCCTAHIKTPYSFRTRITAVQDASQACVWNTEGLPDPWLRLISVDADPASHIPTSLLHPSCSSMLLYAAGMLGARAAGYHCFLETLPVTGCRLLLLLLLLLVVAGLPLALPLLSALLLLLLLRVAASMAGA